MTLARRLGRESFAGLVNAILRSLSREKDALSWPERQADPARYLSVRYSLPQWIVLRLLDAYGEEMAEQIAAWTPQAHTLTVRRTPGRLSREAFEGLMTAKGWRWEPGRLEGAYYVANARDVGLDKDYLQGVFSVQGESSMLAAMAVSPRRGANVLDACAAPGGKTACLSEAMGGTGRVYAWDVHEHRVDLIRGMVRRLRLDNVRPAVRDALHVKEDLLGVMDAVLLDAPCSGLGVMLSKPDVKYRQSPKASPRSCRRSARFWTPAAGMCAPAARWYTPPAPFCPRKTGCRRRRSLRATANSPSTPKGFGPRCRPNSPPGRTAACCSCWRIATGWRAFSSRA